MCAPYPSRRARRRSGAARVASATSRFLREYPTLRRPGGRCARRSTRARSPRAARRGSRSTSARTCSAVTIAIASSSTSGIGSTLAASRALRRRRASSRRTRSIARRCASVPMNVRSRPRSGSNASGRSHSDKKTSWVTSSAARRSPITRAASPNTYEPNWSYISVNAPGSRATRRALTSCSHAVPSTTAIRLPDGPRTALVLFDRVRRARPVGSPLISRRRARSRSAHRGGTDGGSVRHLRASPPWSRAGAGASGS